MEKYLASNQVQRSISIASFLVLSLSGIELFTSANKLMYYYFWICW